MARSRPTWRLVDDLLVPLSAAGQMAADIRLLDEVGSGRLPALRVYRWSPPALSLGRFQADTDVDVDACRRHGVEVVRRPTGGRALLHGGDLTYAVAMPLPADAPSVDARYRLLAAGLIAGLGRLGVEAEIACHEGPTGPVCFTAQRGADLRVGGRKLCGSAQVQRGQALLQHGSILLARLPFDETDLVHHASPAERAEARARLDSATVTMGELGAPTDPAVVAAALVEGFEQAVGVRMTGSSVTCTATCTVTETGARSGGRGRG
ncbi:MAG: octanoyltransferase [Actinomycetia bacterium]|nr:octanoyltransferase [Actinomycetes bacterium]